MSWLPIIIIVAIVIALVVGSFVMESRRREAIKGLADSLGLEYREESSIADLEMFQQVAYFNQGRSHRILNHLFGSTDVTAIHILDYQFTVGSGKNSHTKRQTVVALVSEELELPGFDLAPESFFSRFTELFGAQDIDFQEHPLFSQTFLLQATDEDAVRRLMDRDLMDFFCQKPDIYLSVRRGFLCLYRPGNAAAPDKWKDLMTEGFDTYRALLARLAR